jgi:acyl-[acyl-carrier-protein]-phospholipid O-acyltransferase/long-chain-fatty-acid--[acyl-carrier-protein] ligase
MSRLPAVLARLGAQGLPNLFLPRRDQFVRVEKLPVLGTGKLDVQEVKRIALERLGGTAA